MPSYIITRTDLTDWNDKYTIEYNGPKGWEIVWFQDKSYGIHKASFMFQKYCMNNDGQYRLTTPSWMSEANDSGTRIYRLGKALLLNADTLDWVYKWIPINNPVGLSFASLIQPQKGGEY